MEALAERDHPDALLVLGWLNAAGYGRSPDVPVAEELYKRAQARGQIFAHVLLEELRARETALTHLNDDQTGNVRAPEKESR